MFYFSSIYSIVFLCKSLIHTCDGMLIVNLAILLKIHHKNSVVNQTDLLKK